MFHQTLTTVLKLVRDSNKWPLENYLKMFAFTYNEDNAEAALPPVRTRSDQRTGRTDRQSKWRCSPPSRCSAALLAAYTYTARTYMWSSRPWGPLFSSSNQLKLALPSLELFCALMMKQRLFTIHEQLQQTGDQKTYWWCSIVYVHCFLSISFKILINL